MKHFILKITGRVQGVWFRGSTQRKAKELGLLGFVKNEPDGSVYIEVEGPHEKIKIFADWCWQGPELAKVKNVELEEGEWQGFQTFDTLR